MLLQFANLKSVPGLVHAVTTSRFNAITNFNLADHVGLETEKSIDHRKMLCRHLGIPFERLTVSQQVHQTNVARVTEKDVACGRDGWTSGIPATDAMVTNLVNTPLMVLSADCPLILVYDPKRKAMGVIHASWRCTFGGIIGRTIDAMAGNFGSCPQDMVAGIGPGAGPCCYEVDDKFVDTIRRRPELLEFVVCRGSTRHFDLWSAQKADLVRSGVNPESVEKMGRCSICDETFFSFRRQKDRAGRFGLVACLGN